jgi:hypothetical protein
MTEDIRTCERERASRVSLSACSMTHTVSGGSLASLIDQRPDKIIDALKRQVNRRPSGLSIYTTFEKDPSGTHSSVS